jgi:hypothetical protein
MEVSNSDPTNLICLLKADVIFSVYFLFCPEGNSVTHISIHDSFEGVCAGKLIPVLK